MITGLAGAGALFDKKIQSDKLKLYKSKYNNMLKNNQPATKNDLKELRAEFKNDLNELKINVNDKIDIFRKEILIKTTKDKNEILNSNDGLVKEIKAIREERATIHANYKRVEERVENVETFAQKAAPKLGLSFGRAKA